MSWHIPICEALEQGQTVRFTPRKGVASPTIPKGRQAVLVPVLHAPPKSGSIRDRVFIGDIVFCLVQGMWWLHPVSSIRQVGGRQMYQIKRAGGPIKGWIPLEQIKGRLHSTELKDQ